MTIKVMAEKMGGRDIEGKTSEGKMSGVRPDGWSTQVVRDGHVGW